MVFERDWAACCSSSGSGGDSRLRAVLSSRISAQWSLPYNLNSCTGVKNVLEGETRGSESCWWNWPCFSQWLETSGRILQIHRLKCLQDSFEYSNGSTECQTYRSMFFSKLDEDFWPLSGPSGGYRREVQKNSSNLQNWPDISSNSRLQFQRAPVHFDRGSDDRANSYASKQFSLFENLTEFE